MHINNNYISIDLLIAGRAPWKSQQLPQRKRHRPDDDDCVVINDTEQYNKDSTTEFVTARDQYVSVYLVGVWLVANGDCAGSL